MNLEILLSVSGRSDVGRQRTNNEDAFVIGDARTGEIIECTTGRTFDGAERTTLLAVTDGMGGENAGEVASRLTLGSMRRALSKELPESEPIDALRAAVHYSNEVVSGAAKIPGREGMGATLAAVIVQRDHAYVTGVGDSRVYILRRNQLVQVTKDQSYLQYLIDSGTIGPDQIANFPHKNVILQAVGRAPDLTVQIVRVELRRDDVLLLCTDGLTGEVDDETIRNIVATSPLDVACSRLIATANARGGNDNITVILASVGGEGIAEAKPADVVPVIAFPTTKVHA